jgi:hypothetical protein
VIAGKSISNAIKPCKLRSLTVGMSKPPIAPQSALHFAGGPLGGAADTPPSNFVTGGLALIVAAFASLRDNRDSRVCRCAPGRNGPAAPNHPPRLARVKKRIGLRGLADPCKAGSTHKNDLADVGLNSRLRGNTLRSRPKGER